MPGGNEHRHAGSLGGTHHGLHVVLSKDTFNGDRGGAVATDPVFDDLFDCQKATCDIQLYGRTDDIEGNQQRLSAGDAINHTQPASGQARVNSQHPHAFPSMSRDWIAHAIPLTPLSKRTDVRQPKRRS